MGDLQRRLGTVSDRGYDQDRPQIDPNRLIDQASGWFDQGGGDFSSLHNYFFKLFIRPERERASVLSEFWRLQLSGTRSLCKRKTIRLWNLQKQKRSREAFPRKMEWCAKSGSQQGLSASIYTQWTDVEEEVNGVFTYDREVRKIEPF